MLLVAMAGTSFLLHYSAFLSQASVRPSKCLTSISVGEFYFYHTTLSYEHGSAVELYVLSM